MPKVLIISPSGNLYGSEQVLLDFLASSSMEADVVVPGSSMFEHVLKSKQLVQHIIPFDSTRLAKFYIWVAIRLLRGKYRAVYLNEAGHSKYVLMLSKLFPGKKFVIHVRVTEDAAPTRWLSTPGKNVVVIAISTFIKDRLKIKSTLLLDPYRFTASKPSSEVNQRSEVFRVGVIGRITRTKGVHYLIDLLHLILSAGKAGKYRFLLFGDMAKDVRGSAQETELRRFPNVSFEGFVQSKEEIYNGIDCVLHLSDCEPLGRIFFEAMDFGKPLIGMNAAGIGEIGALTGLDQLLVNPEATDLASLLLEKLEVLSRQYPVHVENIKAGKQAATRIFNQDHYTRTIEDILNR